MLDVDELRGFIETSLGDDVLGVWLDAAYEAIDAYAGPAGDSSGDTGATTEVITPGPGDLLMLTRPASAITAVTETCYGFDTDLALDDVALIGTQMVRRLRTGTNPSSRWRGRVAITYERLPDANERDRVAVGLVRLDVNHNPGITSEQLGDWSATYANNSAMNYSVERQALLSSLTPGFVAK
ncbi:MAG TPA: hypothetical protein VFV72_02530 [Candidatus Limnocylindrales bacterium]|nr:hypothetical protein [Candidatus Limnocylindrales bacterium]